METLFNSFLHLMMLWSGDLYMLSEQTAITVNLSNNTAILDFYDVKYPAEMEAELKEALENWNRYEVNEELKGVIQIASVASYQNVYDNTVLMADLHIIDMDKFLQTLGFEEIEEGYYYFSHYNTELEKEEKFSFTLGFLPDFHMEVKENLSEIIGNSGYSFESVPFEWLLEKDDSDWDY